MYAYEFWFLLLEVTYDPNFDQDFTYAFSIALSPVAGIYILIIISFTYLKRSDLYPDQIVSAYVNTYVET